MGAPITNMMHESDVTDEALIGLVSVMGIPPQDGWPTCVIVSKDAHPQSLRRNDPRGKKKKEIKIQEFVSGGGGIKPRTPSWN